MKKKQSLYVGKEISVFTNQRFDGANQSEALTKNVNRDTARATGTGRRVNMSPNVNTRFCRSYRQKTMLRSLYGCLSKIFQTISHSNWSTRFTANAFSISCKYSRSNQKSNVNNYIISISIGNLRYYRTRLITSRVGKVPF